EDVDASVRLHREIGERGARVDVGDVGDLPDRTVLGDRALHRCAVEISDHELRAVLAERGADREAQAPPDPGDDRDLPVEERRHHANGVVRGWRWWVRSPCSSTVMYRSIQRHSPSTRSNRSVL